MPALLSRISIEPNSLTTVAKADSTDFSLATSIWTGIAVAFRDWISRATDSAPRRFRSAIATCAPSRANASAIAFPIPVAEPVTTADLASSLMVWFINALSRKDAKTQSLRLKAPSTLWAEAEGFSWLAPSCPARGATRSVAGRGFAREGLANSPARSRQLKRSVWHLLARHANAPGARHWPPPNSFVDQESRPH